MIWKMPIRLSILENDDLDKEDLNCIKDNIESFKSFHLFLLQAYLPAYGFSVSSVGCEILEDFDNNKSHYLNVTASIDSDSKTRETMIAESHSLFFTGKMVKDKNTHRVLRLKELKLMYSNHKSNPIVLIP